MAGNTVGAATLRFHMKAGESPMADWEKTIVPLADAHEVFESFRIGPYSKAYHRWRRDDGFRWVD